MADAGYGEVTAFREALESPNLRYAVGVQSTMGLWVVGWADKGQAAAEAPDLGGHAALAGAPAGRLSAGGTLLPVVVIENHYSPLAPKTW